ncbi:hypothetical protein BH11ARM2_BH11ARM2_25150 [soil metagenome]
MTVLRDDVKSRCGETGTGSDAAIDDLIDSIVPALEAGIDPAWLDDASVAPILDLGALEIVTGEFLLRRKRVPGGGESLEVDGLAVRPPHDDGLDLKAHGEARLIPYRRSVPVAAGCDAA